jgi:hypothetical protein
VLLYTVTSLTEFLAGTVLDDDAQSIIGTGKEIKAQKPRKEDIVDDST